MVEKDVAEKKADEKKENFDDEPVDSENTRKRDKIGEKVDSKYREKREKLGEKREKLDEKKEKGKVYSDKFVNDLNCTIDEFKENFKNMQKYADEKINEYRSATVSNLAVDLIETEDTYYLKVAVPGLDKNEIDIEESPKKFQFKQKLNDVNIKDSINLQKMKSNKINLNQIKFNDNIISDTNNPFLNFNKSND